MTGFRLFAALVLIGTASVSAQTTTPAQPPDKRVFGIFPNYRTVEASDPFHPITSRQKMKIAAQDSFDWPVFPTAAALAGFYQATDQNPSFGQGMSGYGKRFGCAYGDQMVANMLVEGVFPSILNEDPRYFRQGQGSTKHRLWYAITRVFVTRTDSGNWTFNKSELAGNSAAVALSNAWYPDTRTAPDAVQRLGIQYGIDALANVLKEFWPDVRRSSRRQSNPATGPAVPGTASRSR